MKGKTVEQASADFEVLWEGANGAVKDKYARRENQGGALSPSEQKNLGANFKPNAPMATDRTARRQSDQVFSEPEVRKSSGTFKKNGQESTGAQPPDAIPKSNAPNPNPKDPAPTGGRGRTTLDAAAPVVAPSAKPVASNGPGKPLPTGFEAPAITQPLELVADFTKFNEDGSQKIAVPRDPAAQPPREAILPTERIKEISGGNPLSHLAQVEVARRQAAIADTPTGKPVIAGKAPAGINRLTGMEYGIQPGDASKANPALAASSLKRSQIASSQEAINPGSTIASPLAQAGAQRMMETAGSTPLGSMTTNAPRAIPAIQPTPSTVETRAVTAMKRAASGADRVPDPADPSQFFTGRVLPLDQLNANRPAPKAIPIAFPKRPQPTRR
jgi:hypothetical protein